MDVVFDNGFREFVCNSDYEERHIPKRAGWSFNGTRKRWVTKSAGFALKLAEYMDVDVREIADGLLETENELERIAEEKKQAVIAASRALEADINIPAPAGLEYMPFQKAGVARIMGRPDSLLADEMGLGKTVQVAGFVNIKKPESVLIVCPAYLKINWKRELEKWLVGGYRVCILTSKAKIDEAANVFIVNYDIVSKAAVSTFIKSSQWGLLACDECHFLKNGKALRTKCILGYEEKKSNVVGIRADVRIFVTGTPILNRPSELWPLLKSCGVATNWFSYHTKFCNGKQTKFGWDVSGSSNRAELQELLRSTIMTRRLKADVLKDLPAKRHQCIEIEPSTPDQLACVRAEVAAKARAEEQSRILKDAVKKAAENGVDSDGYKSAVEALKVGAQATFTELSKLRHATALAKVDVVAEHVLEAFESSGPQVLFCHHRDVAEKLFAALGGRSNAVLVYGGMAPEARQAAVDRFQNGKADFFIGTIKGAGTGITLTRSSHVVFAEADYVPANLTQAEDRVHRIGQVDAVLIQHIVLEGSLDASMARSVVSKQQVIDAVLDDCADMITEAANEE